MITIHSIEDMLNFYASLGGVRKDSINGFCYMFPRRNWLFLSASHWHRNSIPIWISIISWNN